jgi:hypothetical protein
MMSRAIGPCGSWKIVSEKWSGIWGARRTILTDNGKEFTDRLFGLRKRAQSGKHEFDTLCAALEIEHRLTPPRSPQTNGMVERFNGRIEDVLQSHHFQSGEELEATLHRYVWLYNQQLPQSALGSKTPYGPSQHADNWREQMMFASTVLDPLVWSGLLIEVKPPKGKRADSEYFKTPLWRKALTLDTDGALMPRSEH